ncbi:MAG: OmpA family protein [Cytophagales bacterium]|nr:OmpA family protein [Cytophagales bacterium]
MNKITILLIILCTSSFAQTSVDEIINLGKNVNSASSEINPKLTADGKQLFFTRKGKEDGYDIEDIYMSEMGKDNKWKPAVRLDNPFNQDLKNSVTYASVDGNFIIIKGVYKKGQLKVNERGYSIVKKTKSGWGMPETMPIENYDKMDKGYHNGLSMSPAGNACIITLSEIKDNVNNDLYITFRKKDGTWTQPKNMGKPINESSNEFAPFMAADGVTLYFASDRPGGLGETDIWISKRMDDSWVNWSKPVNMGAPVNTAGKEGYYAVDASSQYAFTVSEKNSLGFADIIRIKLKKEQQANPVVLIQGKVLNSKTKNPVEAEIIYEQLPDGKKVGTAHSDPVTGEYKIILPYGKKYGFLAHGKGYLSESNSVDLTTVDEYKEMTADLYLVPLEVGEIVKINNIGFKFGSTELTEESYPELLRIVDELTENPTLVIEIEGHTDNIGSAESNMKLSQNRANSVRTFLLSKGLDESKVKSLGLGETKPIATNETDEGRTVNRRVEFKVLQK